MLLAPPIFILHFLEEAPGFVRWFNVHVDPDITPGLFWSVNLWGLLVTTLIVAATWSQASTLLLIVAVAWLSFLMGANAVFHLVAVAIDRAYAPGAISSAVLYGPYYTWFTARVARTGRVPPGIHAAAALAGATPMVVHGYRIVFLGSRLF